MNKTVAERKNKIKIDLVASESAKRFFLSIGLGTELFHNGYR